MIVTGVLAVFCVLWLAHVQTLSVAAGRLPAVIAVLTLAALAADAVLASRKQARGAPVDLSLLVLLAAAYVAGLAVSLPLYAAWSYRHKPAHALSAAAVTLLFVLGIDFFVPMYRGMLWPE